MYRISSNVISCLIRLGCCQSGETSRHSIFRRMGSPLAGWDRRWQSADSVHVHPSPCNPRKGRCIQRAADSLRVVAVRYVEDGCYCVHLWGGGIASKMCTAAGTSIDGQRWCRNRSTMGRTPLCRLVWGERHRKVEWYACWTGCPGWLLLCAKLGWRYRQQGVHRRWY